MSAHRLICGCDPELEGCTSCATFGDSLRKAVAQSAASLGSHALMEIGVQVALHASCRAGDHAEADSFKLAEAAGLIFDVCGRPQLAAEARAVRIIERGTK